MRENFNVTKSKKNREDRKIMQVRHLLQVLIPQNGQKRKIT